MQYELKLRDWRTMDSAPRTTEWIEAWNGLEIKRVHFAQDLSGEEQPAYSGWFYAVKDKDGKTLYFAGFHKPKRWRPL